MSKLKSILATLLVDGTGWLVLIAPWVYIYGADLYQQVALYVTFVAYGILTLYGLLYFGGSMRCSQQVAFGIIKELQEKDRWYSYFPVALIVIAASVATYKSLYVIAALLMAPPAITWISRQILKLKASKAIHDI